MHKFNAESNDPVVKCSGDRYGSLGWGPAHISMHFLKSVILECFDPAIHTRLPP